MSSKRKSIEIEGVSHGSAPIPMASQIGNFVYSSAIMGKDKTTNALPDNTQDEIACLFRNIAAVMEAADGTPDDIVRMTVYLRSNELRAPFNDQWLIMFPDPHSRPARHITLTELPGKMNVQAEIIAIIK